jgi:hypothetical protein
MKKNDHLNPEVKGIRVKNGARYDDSKACVELEVSDKNGERRSLNVEYPVQGDRHLVMLMCEVKQGENGERISNNIPHNQKCELRDAINCVAKRESE